MEHHVAPRTLTEEILADLWSRLFERPTLVEVAWAVEEAALASLGEEMRLP